MSKDSRMFNTRKKDTLTHTVQISRLVSTECQTSLAGRGQDKTINKLITSAAKVGRLHKGPRAANEKKKFQVVGTEIHLYLGQDQLFETNYIKMKTGSPQKFREHLSSLFKS